MNGYLRHLYFFVGVFLIFVSIFAGSRLNRLGQTPEFIEWNTVYAYPDLHERVKRVHPGDSTGEVRTILGEPLWTGFAGPNYTCWGYSKRKLLPPKLPKLLLPVEFGLEAIVEYLGVDKHKVVEACFTPTERLVYVMEKVY